MMRDDVIQVIHMEIKNERAVFSFAKRFREMRRDCVVLPMTYSTMSMLRHGQVLA